MNRLPGTIRAIQSQGGMTVVEVDCGGIACAATLLGAPLPHWQPGRAITLLCQEAEVALGKDLGGLLSLRNRLPCTVRAVEGGTALARIRLDFQGQALAALITAGSAQRMALAPGDRVEALIKANDMMLEDA